MKKFYLVALMMVCLSLLLQLFEAGCSKKGQSIDIPPGCNPISLDDCFLPFPSSYYLKDDPSTPTGFRVNIPEGVLPSNVEGVGLSPVPYNYADGFSPATPALAYFVEGIDKTTLPSIDNIANSITPESPIQIIEWTTGERVPLFAEIDANAKEGERQALIIRPVIRLKPNERYVVIITDRVHNKNGEPLTVPEPFRIIRENENTSNQVLKDLQSYYREIFEFLEARGIQKEQVILAWDFRTASDTYILSHMLKIREEVLKQAGDTGLGYSITRIEEDPSDTKILRKVFGEFEVPSFLNDDEPRVLKTDEQGMPLFNRIERFTFVVHIPRCAETATTPLRVMIFGHGLFGDAAGEMGSGYEKGLINQLCMIQVGTNWIGLSEGDVPDVLVYTLRDMNYFNVITDRLQQAHANTIMLARLVKGTFVKEPIFSREGPGLDGNCSQATCTPLADPNNPEIYYYGISDGAIQGTTFMTLTPDIERGVLNVGGGPWSFMMFRSSNFPAYKMFLDNYYPDRLDQQILIAITQSLWDFSDPVTYGAHIIKDPLPQTPVKKIILQESKGDAQVPNLSTHILARTMGLKGLAPLVYPVFGIQEVSESAIGDSAYTQWYVKPDANPFPNETVNIPPPPNDAHEAIRRLPELIQQLDLFFRPQGSIVQTCPNGGPCVFENEVMQ